jgi:predicted phage terminase large subunit-like protein
LDVKLLPWQQEVWQSDAMFLVVAAGRRTGKTELAAWRLLINALTDGITDLDAARFYVAPTQGQARDVMWKKLLQLGSSVITGTHVNNLEVTLVNGQTIALKGADRPETMRGVKLADLVLDEYADMKPYVLEEILMPALSDYNTGYLMIGSPMGRNHFYDEWKKASLGKDKDYAAFHFTSFDNPLIDPKLIEKRKLQMSSYAFRQEFMASFEARGSELFKEEWFEWYEDIPKHSTGDYYIAGDLAGFEEVGSRKSKNLDDSAFAVVYVEDSGTWYVEEIVAGRWTLDRTAETLFRLVEKYQPKGVGIERGIAKQAVMSPLMDMQRRTGRWFGVQELTHGNRKKSDRIVWALQGRLENGLIKFKRDTKWNAKFIDQLSQFPDPLTHDDTIDALAYIDQIAKVSYMDGTEDQDDFEYLDAEAGY